MTSAKALRTERKQMWTSEPLRETKGKRIRKRGHGGGTIFRRTSIVKPIWSSDRRQERHASQESFRIRSRIHRCILGGRSVALLETLLEANDRAGGDEWNVDGEKKD